MPRQLFKQVLWQDKSSVWVSLLSLTSVSVLARKCFRNEKIWKQTSWTLDQGWKFRDIIQKRSKSSSSCPVLIMNAVSVRIFPLLKVLCLCDAVFTVCRDLPCTPNESDSLVSFKIRSEDRFADDWGNNRSESESCSGFFLRDMINSWKWGNEVSGFAELAQRLLTHGASHLLHEF